MLKCCVSPLPCCLLFWLGCLLAVPVPGLHAVVAAEPQSVARPNIIWILADDFGLPDVGCYGGVYRTPALDSLASGGTRFDFCFAAPLCAPSRAMCMFGRYGFRTGVRDNGQGAAATPQREVCIAKVLKQAGYATAVAGKWSDLEYLVTAEDGRRWGFDQFMIWGERWEEGGGRSRYWGPDYNHNGVIISGDKRTFGPDLLQKFAVDFIRQNREGPFFLYYPTPLIHYKLQRTPDSSGGESDLHSDNIEYLDKLVGQLVSELESLQLREKTLIIFVGDNGSTKGQHTVHGRPIFGKKGELKEGGCRVPLIVNWPGTTPAGSVSQDLVSLTDFFPTLAELAGAPLPEVVSIDGVSLASRFQGRSGQSREWVYVQLREECYVRDGRWKLTGAGGLFDMREAPWQEIAVAADVTDPLAQQARIRLQTALDGMAAAAAGHSEP